MHLDAEKFIVIGNNLSLDFANTEIVAAGATLELLQTADDLAAWAVAVGLLEAPQAVRLVKSWQADAAAQSEFAQALRFRKQWRNQVIALAQGEPVSAALLKEINSLLREPNGYAEVVSDEGGFAKRFRVQIRTPCQLLAPVAEAVADLLCYGNLAYVKKCEGAECVLYFYDTTKNHSRRWCSMQACGNRAKVAAFYQRQRRALPSKRGRRG